MTNDDAIKILKRMVRVGIAYDDGYAIEPLAKDENTACKMAIEALKAQRVGKWNIHISCIDGRKLFVCPFCNCGFYIPVYERKYCPNCGAKMEGINE